MSHTLSDALCSLAICMSLWFIAWASPTQMHPDHTLPQVQHVALTFVFVFFFIFFFIFFFNALTFALGSSSLLCATPAGIQSVTLTDEQICTELTSRLSLCNAGEKPGEYMFPSSIPQADNPAVYSV